MSIARVQDAHCRANLTDLVRCKGKHVLQVRTALAGRRSRFCRDASSFCSRAWSGHHWPRKRRHAHSADVKEAQQCKTVRMPDVKARKLSS